MDFFNPIVIFLIVIIFSSRESNLDFGINSRLFDIINCVSSSDNEPSAIDRKYENSLGDVLAAPFYPMKLFISKSFLIYFLYTFCHK